MSKNKDLQTAKETFETADKYANETYGKGIEERVQEVANKLNSDSITTQAQGKAEARKMVEDLTMLMLYQEVQGNKRAGYLDFGNKFNDGWIKEGNAKQYIIHNDTGHDIYDPAEFVPTEVTQENAEQWIIQMYTRDSSTQKPKLSPQAYQFRKQKTIRDVDWIPYFQSGKLSTYLEIIRSEIARTLDMYIFHKIATLITSSTPQFTMEGQGKDMFESMVEFLSEVKSMETYDTKYNYSNKNFLQTTSPNELMIIMHPNNITKLKTGIRTQLFHQELLGLGDLLNDGNVYNLGKKLNIPTDGKTEITIGSDFYVDEDTIWVVRKDAIKHVMQVYQSGTQSYPLNMTTLLVQHAWGAADILPWGVMWKYHNVNLKKMPE